MFVGHFYFFLLWTPVLWQEVRALFRKMTLLWARVICSHEIVPETPTTTTNRTHYSSFSTQPFFKRLSWIHFNVRWIILNYQDYGNTSFFNYAKTQIAHKIVKDLSATSCQRWHTEWKKRQ